VSDGVSTGDLALDFLVDLVVGGFPLLGVDCVCVSVGVVEDCVCVVVGDLDFFRCFLFDTGGCVVCVVDEDESLCVVDEDDCVSV
jgi:hypothetical protein